MAKGLHQVVELRQTAYRKIRGSRLSEPVSKIVGFECERCDGTWKNRPSSANCPNPLVCEQEGCGKPAPVYTDRVTGLPICAGCVVARN